MIRFRRFVRTVAPTSCSRGAGRALACALLSGLCLLTFFAASPAMAKAGKIPSGAVLCNQSTPTGPAGAINDGNVNTSWNAGQAAPPSQGCVINLGTKCGPKGHGWTVSEVKLVVNQNPAGNTEHRLHFWDYNNNNIPMKLNTGQVVPYKTFLLYTTDREVLDFTLQHPVAGVCKLYLATVQSPSWVSWREVTAYATNAK